MLFVLKNVLKVLNFLSWKKFLCSYLDIVISALTCSGARCTFNALADSRISIEQSARWESGLLELIENVAGIRFFDSHCGCDVVLVDLNRASCSSHCRVYCLWRFGICICTHFISSCIWLYACHKKKSSTHYVFFCLLDRFLYTFGCKFEISVDFRCDLPVNVAFFSSMTRWRRPFKN